MIFISRKKQETMTREEIINKAIIIQFPLTYTTYFKYNNIKKEIHKLPLPKKGLMYDTWGFNNHHFTTEYARKYVIPLLVKLFNIDFDENDFILDKRKCNNFDISLLKPKKNFVFDVIGYTQNKHNENVDWNFLTTSNSKEYGITKYHTLYVYPHECSRIINKTIDSNRKLFISGDSQLIPIVSFLACFFKEIWYFDNRKKLKLSDKWKNINFTDVLIELNNKKQEVYFNTNFN